MRESIDVVRLILSLILGIANTALCIAVIVTHASPLNPFVFLTNWGLWSNSFYLLVVMICDTIFFFKKDPQDFFEKINNFFRNSYSLVSFPLSYTIFLLYWVLLFSGGFSRPDGKEGGKSGLNSINFLNIYMHGLITVFLLIDLFVANHEVKKITWKYIAICSGVYWCYAVVALIWTFVFNLPPYAFLAKVPIWMLILLGIVFNLVLIGFYVIHIQLLKKKSPTKKEEETPFVGEKTPE